MNHRIQVIRDLRRRAAELEKDRIAMADNACIAFKAMKSKLHLPLLIELTEKLGIKDDKLGEKLQLGLPIVGKADESPFFYQYVIPAKLTTLELLQGARANTIVLENKIVQESKRAEPDILMAVYLKTKKEVEVSGTMGPPLSKDQVDSKYGKHWNGVQRFGIRQGVDNDGNPKYHNVAKNDLFPALYP